HALSAHRSHAPGGTRLCDQNEIAMADGGMIRESSEVDRIVPTGTIRIIEEKAVGEVVDDLRHAAADRRVQMEIPAAEDTKRPEPREIGLRKDDLVTLSRREVGNGIDIGD